MMLPQQEVTCECRLQKEKTSPMQTGYAELPSHRGGSVRSTEMFSDQRPTRRLEFLHQPLAAEKC